MLAHFNDMVPSARKFLPRSDMKFLDPIINMKQRVQFKVREETNGDGSGDAVWKAFDVRYENPPRFDRDSSPTTSSGDFPMLNWPEIIALVRKSKSTLGYEIYDSLEKAYLRGERRTVTRVKRSLEACDERVSWLRGQVCSRPKTAARVKERLGEEIYDLLSNISAETDVEGKADAAYYRCLQDMLDLGLDLSPNQVEELGGYVRAKRREAEREARFGHV